MCDVCVFLAYYWAFIGHLLVIYWAFITRVSLVFYVCLDEENRRSSQGVISGIRKNVVMVLP